MIKIVLTGPTGSGKGYVSDLFEKRGIPTLDTDRVVHQLYRDPTFAEELCKLFSANILSPSGEIDRKKLAKIIFSDEKAKKALLSRVYPAVREVCREFLKNAEAEGKRAAVVDAPQIFEAGFAGDFDLTVCVIAPKEERLARILARDTLTIEEAERRMAHQLSEEDYQKRCVVTIKNGSGDDPERQIEQLLGGSV